MFGPGEYTVKAYYGGTQYGKDANLTVNDCGVGNALIDGKGCTTVKTEPATSGIFVYIRDLISCNDVWFMTTNGAGIAQDCSGTYSGTYYAEAFFNSGSCFGENSIMVDENHTGFTTVTQGTGCTCPL